MKALRFNRFIYGLYIKGGRFICYFESEKEALDFANAFYRGVEAHIEPYWIFTFKEQ